jgi:hypothetical protein
MSATSVVEAEDWIRVLSVRSFGRCRVSFVSCLMLLFVGNGAWQSDANCTATQTDCKQEERSQTLTTRLIFVLLFVIGTNVVVVVHRYDMQMLLTKNITSMLKKEKRDEIEELCTVRNVVAAASGVCC